MYNWNVNYINNLIKELDNIGNDTIPIRDDMDAEEKNIRMFCNIINNVLNKSFRDKEIVEDIDALKELILIKKNKEKFSNKELSHNLYFENENYKVLKHYNSLVNPIINKYCDYTDYDINFNNIDFNKEDLLIHTRDNIKNISREWALKLEPYIFNKDIIDFNTGNDNFMLYINTLKKFFVSLSKDNNINDFILPTHEFLHIYAVLLNEKNFV